MALREQIKEAMKATKFSVDYSKGNATEHCGSCKHYHDHTCTEVQGMIEPGMWCKLWKME